MTCIDIQYQREQLIFLDESAKDNRTISCRYGYSEIITRVIKKVLDDRRRNLPGANIKYYNVIRYNQFL